LVILLAVHTIVTNGQTVTMADARHCPVTIGHPVPSSKPWREGLFGWQMQGGEPEYGGYLNCAKNGRLAASPRVQVWLPRSGSP
jgi:hypothetical protein